MPILKLVDVYTEEHLRNKVAEMTQPQNENINLSPFNQIKSSLEQVGIELACNLKGVEIYLSNNPKSAEKIMKFFDYLCCIKTSFTENITSLKSDLRNKEFYEKVPDGMKFPIKDMKVFFGGGIHPEFNNNLEVDISATHRLMLDFSDNKIEIKGLGVMSWH
jgi:hypothetical protein